MEWEDVQGKKSAGFGRCIYCGVPLDDNNGIHDEHIIPYSLGGNAEIKDANCTACLRATHAPDTHLADIVFNDLRVHANIQTRNPKDRETILPARFTIGDADISRDLPIKDHPFSLALPVWGDPGFITGARIDAPFPEAYLNYYNFVPANIRETLGIDETEPYKIWKDASRVKVELFARAIAKIAYCNALIRYGGLGRFRPLALPDIILGRCSAVAHFVGTPLKYPPPPWPQRIRHGVAFSEMRMVRSDSTVLLGSMALILAHVRLFADSGYKEHGTPIYTVIAGAMGAPKALRSKRLLVTPRRFFL